MRNKGLVVMLSVIMLLSVILSACGSDNNNATEAPGQTPGTEESGSKNADKGEKSDGSGGNTEENSDNQVMLGKKFDPPVEMSTVRWVTGSFGFREGDDIANNAMTRWMKEDLGINLITDWSVEGQDNYMTKLRLSLSASQPLPDVFVMPDMVLAREMIEAGLVKPVGKAFEQYGSEILKKAYATDPSVWYPVYHDGQYYGLPILSAGDHHDAVMYIRTDWLENVGLEAPTNFDELEEVMDAFVNKDPDGNGQKDTIALAMSFKDGKGVTTTADASWIFGGFGTMPGLWHENDDGQLTYGSLQPQVKEALARLKEWKQKGYVHQEIGLHEGNKAAEPFLAGKAGIMMGAPWNVVYPLPGLEKNDPEAKYEPFTLPKGPTGEIGRVGNAFTKGVILFNKDFDRMDAFFLYHNNLFEYWNPENEQFKNGYFKGYDYDIIDGKVVNGSDIPGGQITVHHYFLNNSERPILPYQYQDTMTELYEGKEPETAFERYSAAFDKRYQKALYLSKQMRGAEFYDKSNAYVTPTMKTRGDRLTQMEEETFVKIVYGDLPLDAFDKFVNDWKANGGDKITQEMNDWYSSVNK